MPGNGDVAGANYGDLLITSLLVLGAVCIVAFVAVRVFGRLLATGRTRGAHLMDVVARVPLEPRKTVSFNVPASGVRGFGDYNYLLTTHSTEGFIPHLLEPANMDYRNLGAQLRFRPVTPAEASEGRALPK